MKQTISILGCGWLGMALATALIKNGYSVKGSLTSKDKFSELKSQGIIPFVIDLKKINYDISGFLSSDVLIICIPSKKVNDFENLIPQIEKSEVKNVLFISSTSVYTNKNQIVTEETPIKESPLCEIELLFKSNTIFKSTVIRFGGLFGYNRKPGEFIKENKIIENPEGYVNLIHRDDCIRIIEKIIKKDIWNETLNACADTHPKRRIFYNKEMIKVGRTEPVFNENSSSDYKIVSNKKLKILLNFSFKYSDLLDNES
ncbi:MAG: nucleoside-diphosphate-sugar epimerase [Mariniflexile sp.]